MGLPTFWDGNNDLILYDTYKELLISKKEYCAHIPLLAPGIKGSTIFKILYNDYNILFELKHIFSELGAPSYDDHSELDMMVRNDRDHKYPLGK